MKKLLLIIAFILLVQSDLYASQSQYITKAELLSTLEVSLNAFVIAFLFTAIGVYWSLYKSVKKTNLVTEEKTNLLTDLLKTSHEKATEKHHKIINHTEKISGDTNRLINLTERIETNIINIPKDPKKYQKALKKNLEEQKEILDETQKELIHKNLEFIQLQSSFNDISSLNTAELSTLSEKVSIMEQQLIKQYAYIHQTHDIISNLTPITNDGIREMISEELKEIQ